MVCDDTEFCGTAVILARAKVNLYLHVTGSSRNGYHRLDSLHVRTCLADRLWIVPAPEMRLDVSGPFAGPLDGVEDAMNLVMQAVIEVCRACSSRRKFRIHLEKNIPVAAGLGGGSADAAAALRAVSATLGCATELSGIASSLGADVAPCLHDGAVITSGRGDIARPAPSLPRCAVVLVNPGSSLPTRRVFEVHTRPFSKPQPMSRPVGSYEELVRELGARHNDLETSACRLEPMIADVLAMLNEQPEISIARMTGSGATCFGLTDSIDRAREAAETLRLRRPDCWVEATGLVTGS